jgi:hypothetical protein
MKKKLMHNREPTLAQGDSAHSLAARYGLMAERLSGPRSNPWPQQARRQQRPTVRRVVTVARAAWVARFPPGTWMMRSREVAGSSLWRSRGTRWAWMGRRGLTGVRRHRRGGRKKGNLTAFVAGEDPAVVSSGRGLLL